MDFNASLYFRGECGPWLIKEDEETGLTDITFDSGYGEVILCFDAVSFRDLALAINQFLSSGKVFHPDKKKKSQCEIDLSLPIYDKKTSINVDLGDTVDASPGLMIGIEGKQLLELYFDLDQAREIRDRCGKICEIFRLSKEVETKKTIQAAG